MAQLNIVSPDNYPIWFNGKVINEAVFCDEFLETHALVYTENSFFTPDGKLTDLNRLKAEVFGLIEPFVCTNVDKKLDNIVKLLKLKSGVDDLPPQLDRVNLANGTLFMDGRFVSGKHEVVRTRFPISYVPDAPPPETWLRFLNGLLFPEDIPTFQEFIGYCLIASNDAQKMMIIKGKGGEGKSQIGSVLFRLFGQYAKDGSIGKVSEDRFARADLEHIYLMIDDDMQMSALKKSNLIKSIVTASGKMDLEKKNHQSYQGRMYARLLGFSNGDLQALYDRSNGFFRRQLILTTRDKDPNRKDDPNLARKMSAEIEGIFLWAFAGLQRLLANDFCFTESKRTKFNQEYVRKDANNILLFMESEGYIKYGDGLTIDSREFCALYRLWCEENAYPPMKDKTVMEYLNQNQERFGITYDNNIRNSANRRVRGFHGIGAAIHLPMSTADGWQKIYPRDNPFEET